MGGGEHIKALALHRLTRDCASGAGGAPGDLAHGLGIEESLLIDATDALERADIEGILRTAVARAFARELTVRLLVGFGLFQRGASWLSLSTKPSCALFASNALSRFCMVSRSWRCQTQRTPAADTLNPRFFSSLATRS